MQRENAPSTTTTPAQRRREARESRRTTRQLPAIETDIDSSDDSPNQAMSVNSNNLFPSFLDANSRPPPPQQVNGNGGPMNGMNLSVPMNAGHQMDVNMLYQKILELSDLLRENREKTQAIIAGAEELAVRAAANGASPSLQEANAEISAARIAELEQQLSHEQNRNRTIMREQKENTRLIGEYETAVGNIVEMVRNYSYNNKQERTSLSLHYNKLLQDEKDAHLAARLEKDEWQVRYMRSVEMLREAYKLRCEEEEVPIKIVSGLQNEVRAYRNALGMEPEKVEEEYGWEFLKDAPDAGRED
ncbi:MAG: hypothetical protein L6R40_002387 [Gallowayella cf. fulva]|nr:MAG: hypothetical protein L6R40_002387 [Xanthomendoza cf. fulva]